MWLIVVFDVKFTDLIPNKRCVFDSPHAKPNNPTQLNGPSAVSIAFVSQLATHVDSRALVETQLFFTAHLNRHHTDA